jgi:hypothetical protein
MAPLNGAGSDQLIALPVASTYPASMNQLRITYKRDDDGSGELFATLSAGDFSGKSSAWISESDVLKFISALGAFPIDPADEPLLQGGYWREGRLDQIHVRVRIEPNGPRGFLRVGVELATPIVPSQIPALQHSVCAQFLVTYGDLEQFQESFRVHLKGDRGEAVLQQSPT